MASIRNRTAPDYAFDRPYLSDIADVLGAYDKAIHNFLSCPRFDYGSRGVPNIKPLRVIKASPEAAFADIRDRFKDDAAGREVLEFERSQEQLPLPIASFTRSDLIFDPTRFNPNSSTSIGPSGAASFLRACKDERFTHRFPLPYNISYQVDFWTRYESTLDALRVWLALEFRDGGSFRYLVVDLNDVSRHYGIQRIYMSYNGINDTSDLEPATEPRIERATASIELQGWIFFPVQVVKTMLSTILDIVEVPDGAVPDGVTLDSISEETLAEICIPANLLEEWTEPKE